MSEGDEPWWRPLANACEDFLSAIEDGDPREEMLDVIRAASGAQRALMFLDRGELEPQYFVCAGCDETFPWIPEQPADIAPRYCGHDCKQRNTRWRQAEFARRLNEGLGLCPTPLKRGYRSWEEADQAVARTPDPVGGLRSYRCVCGAHHIGHPRPSRHRERAS